MSYGALDNKTTILYGEFIVVKVPRECQPDKGWALEPWYVALSYKDNFILDSCPPTQEITSVDHEIHFVNFKDRPVMIRRQVRAVTDFGNVCPIVSSSVSLCPLQVEYSVNPDVLISDEV